MTTLVTGGTGAIGSWVLRRLIEQEGQRPVAFDIRPDFTLLSDLNDQFDFVQGDILDLGRILRTINEHTID
ncbi:MAG: NAD-dependent epimerase/dehydratase family protein, partial [Planctomycetes bacterium]|nr:NAD-dependent epimerase/dehydratase family protein [Planctomycetota bacterium]